MFSIVNNNNNNNNNNFILLYFRTPWRQTEYNIQILQR